jgi:hypothetical protein
MPCSAEFWHVFSTTLGVVLALLPAIIVCWSCFGGWQYLTERAERRAREAETSLARRVAALEGRLLPFDEARRPRGG